jgi:arginine/lysine/histidine transporter system substrate-binding protein
LLKAGKADFVMSGLSVTEERLKNVDFSREYYKNSFAIITLIDQPITNINQLENKAIGAQLGSLMEKLLQEKSQEIQGLKISSLTNNMQLIQELKLGRINGVMVGAIQAKNFTANDPGLTYTILEDIAGEGSAIAFPKGSKLQLIFNKTIEDLRKNGELDSLEEKWLTGTNDTGALFDSLLSIPKGVFVTLKYAIISVILGLIFGIVLSICKISHYKTLRIVANVYTSVFRGTPLLVQLSLVYFALPSLIGFDLSAFSAGIIAFSLNSSAYISEIIRAGIQAVDRGQFDAAKALGIPYNLMIKRIILPQAIRNILPSLINEMVNMVKESAIISVIGEADLMRRAQIVAAEHYTYFEPIMVAAACYYIVVLFLSFIANIIEKKMRIQ